MPDGEPLNRRQRKRLETYEEIVSVGRHLLNTNTDLSLRAVAAEMGLTPPSLYRYVDSVETLNAVVAGGILEDVLASMAEIRDSYPDDDPAAQLAAVTTVFRAWALEHRLEFQLVFATPSPVDHDGRMRPVSMRDGHIGSGSDLLSNFFGSIFAKLCMTGRIKAPGTAELGPDVVKVVEASLMAEQQPLMAILGDSGPGTIWLLKLAWARLYGVLTMEVFDQIDRNIIESGFLFAELMHETFISLGMDDDWDRLLGITREVTEARVVRSADA